VQGGTEHFISNPEYRILVVAPSGRDADLICRLLEDVNLHCAACTSVESACAQMSAPTGAVIIAEEALSPERVVRLAEIIDHQPSWSDFPLILLTIPGVVSASSVQRSLLRRPLGNVLLLERPIRPETLVSTLQNALRARQRQYQLRDQMLQQQQAEQALRQSEKLAVAGRLAASITHEINNPLEAVTNLLYLIETSQDLNSVKEYARLASDELKRVAEITAHTLNFHRQPINPVMVDIPDVIDSVLTLYRQRLKSAGISVEREYDRAPRVLGMSGELRQLFANLIGNAADAMRMGGVLKIRVKGVSARTGANPREAGVRVLVADSGSGIAPQHKKRIFEPFFSTKGNTGTGLGLWVSASIVEKHSGSVQVRSCTNPQNPGTVFSVFLPAEQSQPHLVQGAVAKEQIA
jgi:signal transduction histidine kinase